MLRIGQTISNVAVKTTAGDLGIHEYFEGSWGLLVCYVTDFSAVCANELSRLANEFHKFESRGVKILAMSCDSIDSHIKWIEDVKQIGGIKSDEQFPFPIVSDRNRTFSLYLNVLDAKSIDEDGIPLPCRATFVLAPDLTIQIVHLYPQTTGRNFDEILRSIDALKVTFDFNNNVFTPSGWQPLSDCFMSPKISKDDIEKRSLTSKVVELPSGKKYMRIISKMEIKKNYMKNEPNLKTT